MREANTSSIIIFKWNLNLLNSSSTFFFFFHVRSKSSLGNSILGWNSSFTNSIFKKQSNLLNTFNRMLFTEFFPKNILFTKFCHESQSYYFEPKFIEWIKTNGSFPIFCQTCRSFFFLQLLTK